MASSDDVVAKWQLALPDGLHVVIFEHGTTSGKRVIWVDGKDIFRKEWMFKLVGKEHFEVGKAKCTIGVEAVSGFAYEYTLEVNGKPLQKFRENQRKIQKAWNVVVDGEIKRICLEKDTLDVWMADRMVETQGVFTDTGVETYFNISERMTGRIVATSSGKKSKGIIHTLFVNDDEILEATNE
ncbi:fas apoptotic inhibitory molecule 1-like [Mizuhopecten yessoensis]|uniref:Fas apoptotic inhibitory molecule 1 n=1 Tax=Mizuhopecten yessoensis TaxID=6573 RepID=A0A210Q606_MIZYE|nr:fas apoptotic inhibitory molecule 1-like [Mizuhopecten yessoensis]OWF44174.1 Fas apoptotic inhibitory molecule 1 [Mizuhopecten yessoensis]